MIAEELSIKKGTVPLIFAENLGMKKVCAQEHY
jgi:hypothetical protein